MTRMRWKVMDSHWICVNCKSYFPRGTINIGLVCVHCTLPSPALKVTDDFRLTYYQELQRAVRARLGYSPDP